MPVKAGRLLFYSFISKVYHLYPQLLIVLTNINIMCKQLDEIKLSFLPILNYSVSVKYLSTEAQRIGRFIFKNQIYVFVIKDNGIGYFKLVDSKLPKHHIECVKDDNGQFVDVYYLN